MMSRARGWLAPAVILAGGLLLVYGLGFAPSQRVLSLVLIWAAMGLSWNVIGGYGGQVSFGHAAFFGIGAYTSTLLAVMVGVPPIVGIWAGILVAVAAALLIGWPTFRLAGIYFSLATLAYPLILWPIFEYLGYQEVSVPFARTNAWMSFQFSDPRMLSVLALILVVAAVTVTRAIERARLGRALMAVRDDQAAAEAAGIDSFRTKMVAYAISAAIAAAAGTLYAAVLLVVTPTAFFGLIVSVNALIIPVVGGIATVWGPLIGAAILITLSDYLTSNYGAVLPGINGVVFGCALVAIVLFAPEGLFWRVRDLVGRLVRRPAEPAPARAAVGGEPGPAPASPAAASATVLSAEPAPVTTHTAATAAEPEPVGARNTGRGRPADAHDLVRVEGITKLFGGLRALDDVTFTVEQGELLGVIGPNGAGKTTLFDILNGFTAADGGRVIVDERDVTGLKPNRMCRQHRVGRTFQTVRPFRRMSLIENVEIAAFGVVSDRDDARRRGERALERVGLAHRRNAPASDLNVSELRAMELARSLAGEPKLLLVDEFLAGLGREDIAHLVGVLAGLRDEGVTVVVIEHTMGAMVGLVDRFVVLDHGRPIADGPPEEIVRDPAVVEAYLGKRWVKQHADG